MTDENQFTALVLEEDDEHKVTAAIQTLADERLPELPDTPTTTELGMPTEAIVMQRIA